MNVKWYEPRQANLCLRAFRHDKFYLRMPSHSDEPGIWLSVWRFLLTHCLYERAAEVLARLRGCAGSPEPSLLAYAISTKFALRGPYNISESLMNACKCINKQWHCPTSGNWNDVNLKYNFLLRILSFSKSRKYELIRTTCIVRTWCFLECSEVPRVVMLSMKGS